jgi:hypothetical protein
MELLDRIPLGKEAAILGSRYLTQTDDDRVVYRFIESCESSLLFEVVDGEVFLIASDGTFDEFEEYARRLAEVEYPKNAPGAGVSRPATG